MQAKNHFSPWAVFAVASHGRCFWNLSARIEQDAFWIRKLWITSWLRKLKKLTSSRIINYTSPAARLTSRIQKVWQAFQPSQLEQLRYQFDKLDWLQESSTHGKRRGDLAGNGKVFLRLYIFHKIASDFFWINFA